MCEDLNGVTVERLRRAYAHAAKQVRIYTDVDVIDGRVELRSLPSWLRRLKIDPRDQHL